ncbi:hypothetical protein M8J77_012098 [Diaphorina citri]|nr:hypothetical protein M8J77_012098 [Diaphorina citri]
MSILRSVVHTIAAPLADIFNSSFSSSTFPDCFKTSVVSPVFKKGATTEVGNYRPISLLSNFSKILEKLVNYRLYFHLQGANMLNDKQFGFRAGKSTADAVANFLKDLDLSQSSRNHSIGLFCDLSKAFDRVDHSILLSKLPFYGVGENSLKWFQSYLVGRNQTTKIPTVTNGVKNFVNSSSKNVNLGVPQGSVLGPLLFLIYINDIIFSTGVGKFTLFADDTTILVDGKSRQEVLSKLTTVLNDIQGWFTANRLTLNADKTTFVYFNPHNPDSLHPIPFNSSSVAPSQEVKFLGVILDAKLKWKSHIHSLKSKLSSSIYAIRSIKTNVNVNSALLSYHAYFHSLMSYGIVYWGFSSPASEIFLLQKRALRAVFGFGRRDSCRTLFKDNNILTLYGQVILDSCVLIHKLQNTLSRHSDYHHYPTRIRDNIVISRERMFGKSFLSAGISIYNNLPSSLKSLSNERFKPALKDVLLNSCPYSIQEFSLT